MAVEIRPAQKNDAVHVAALMDIAGHGIESAFWAANASADGSAFEGARQRIIEDRSLPSHLSRALMLDVDGEVAGTLIGGPVPPGAEAPPGFPDYFAPLLALEAHAAEHWAVIGLAVYPEYRGRGFARLLLHHAETLARRSGSVGVSLVVEDDNERALALYRSAGFAEQERRRWLPYGNRTGPAYWLLLSRPI